MRTPVFALWQQKIVDNRGKELEDFEEASFNFPYEFRDQRVAKSFIGWDGFVIFDKETDKVKLASEYAKKYQEYSEACGRCTPGRWGGRILYDLLDKIARGEGTHKDLEHLKEIASTMKNSSKCEIGKTVPNPILGLIEHFEDEFFDCIDNKKASPKYGEDYSEYVTKVTAPCVDACPDHVDIPSYIEGVRDLRLDESLRATRKTMPLAHTCGRVCPHPCEEECRRMHLDSSLSIMQLKRLGANYESDHNLEIIHPVEKKESIGKKVAIVGAGPAGLTAGYYLQMDGVDCDIYEELPVLGGEVMVGVPEYRMPKDKYNDDIEFVRSSGVNFILNTRVTADMLREFEKSYDAIILASGTRISKKVRAGNENPDMGGYWPAISFLDQINLADKFGLAPKVDLTDKNVVCVGGGFTSMDVVRCAIRAGAKSVTMLYRRDKKTIINNTSFEEYKEAVEEGVNFIFYSAIEEIVDDSEKITSLKCNMFELIPSPDGGRANLVKKQGEDFIIDCDYLIPAVSQDADLSYIPKEWELALTSWGSIKTDGKNFLTSRPKVWAAGDCEYGPMTIVNAVGQAKRASSVVSRFLRTGEITRSNDEIMEDLYRKMKVFNKNEKVTGWLNGMKSSSSKKIDAEYRKHNNDEVNLGFTHEQAISEAERCMRCYYIGMLEVGGLNEANS